ncbi:MAG: hypothetical protein GZ087_12565 [Flavobacterium sp.]|nr:hypothetical protein [Flavobacterium sp.]
MSDAVLISTVLGGCGLLITLIYNYKNTQLANHKMHKELFTEFNKKYDTLNGDLNYICSLSKGFFLEFDMGEDSRRLQTVINDFFNLCAEEYYWSREKRIPKRVWKSWEKGMNDIYNQSEIIRHYWDEECKNEGHLSYYIDRKDDFFKLR